MLDVAQLSIDSGVPRDVVKMLLEGKEPPAEDITDRIVRRFDHLRETRLRPDGSRHSYEEIAAAFGASRASLSNLVNSRRKTTERSAEQRTGRSGGPLASTQAGIERFYFGQPNGLLSAEPETALDDALQPVLRRLEGRAVDPMARLRNEYGLRRLAARAPQLAEEEIQLVTDWIDTILERRRALGAESPGTDGTRPDSR
ncbi:XRE family transcriptional regulator [Streptomyces sp. NPDC057950]|uniref:XRE family transcriptional regulator n=1 Tax=Streptomyces sp. NPDC057950 TaxID=3346288 RepID=UPI0036EC52E3